MQGSVGVFQVQFAMARSSRLETCIIIPPFPLSCHIISHEGELRLGTSGEQYVGEQVAHALKNKCSCPVETVLLASIKNGELKIQNLQNGGSNRSPSAVTSTKKSLSSSRIRQSVQRYGHRLEQDMTIPIDTLTKLIQEVFK